MSEAAQGETLDKILIAYRGQKGVLLEVLHRVQEAYGYIPQEAVMAIARALRMSPAQVYGMITFYSEFRLSPPARSSVAICDGPACHLRGADRIARLAEAILGIKMGEQAEDGGLSLRWETCPGICNIAPFVRINGQLYGFVHIKQVAELLQKARAS